MKIAHAQLYMYTNIMYKFQSSMCKTVEKSSGRNCVHRQTARQTDRWTGGHENCRRKAPDKIVSMGERYGQPWRF